MPPYVRTQVNRPSTVVARGFPTPSESSLDLPLRVSSYERKEHQELSRRIILRPEATLVGRVEHGDRGAVVLCSISAAASNGRQATRDCQEDRNAAHPKTAAHCSVSAHATMEHDCLPVSRTFFVVVAIRPPAQPAGPLGSMWLSQNGVRFQGALGVW